MPRITAVGREQVAPRAGALLDAVGQNLGPVPNMMRTMAQGPAVLDGSPRAHSMNLGPDTGGA